MLAAGVLSRLCSPMAPLWYNLPRTEADVISSDCRMPKCGMFVEGRSA